jgi:hypothetical protein
MRAKSILIVSTLLCSACAFHGQMNRATVDYNQAVAEASNELTLLNIARAMERYPLHFTSISKISGTFKVVGRTGLGIDILESGGSSKLSPAGALLERSTTIGAEKFTPSTGAEVTAGPSFDIGVLDTQEFYQGILTSVEPAMIGNFLNLGWPDDLVAAMLIERVEFHIPRSATISTNNPLGQRMAPRPFGGGEAIWVLDNKARSAAFGRFLRCFHLKPSTKNQLPEPLWPVSQMDKFKISDLALLDRNKIDLTKEDDPAKRSIQRARPASVGLTLRDVAVRNGGLPDQQCSFVLVPEHPAQEEETVSIDIYHSEARELSQLADLEHGGEQQLAVQITLAGEQNKDDRTQEANATVHIILRSAQAVLYFLGEYAREPNPYRLRDGSPVIVLDRSNDPNAFMRARLRGVTYAVPGDPQQRGRSATAIDLAQQLVNLNKSAKDKPLTASFRLVD